MGACVLLAALFAYVIDIQTSDENFDFINVPDSLYAYEAGIIPGSCAFYDELMIDKDRTWTAYTNRYFVATTNAAVGPTYALPSATCRYSAVYDLRAAMAQFGAAPKSPDTGIVEWRPGVFDFDQEATIGTNATACNVRFRYNGDGTNESFASFYPASAQSNRYNDAIFAPRSMRLTPKNYKALLASYEAYYERLYYASQGQSNAWDEAEWGPKSPGYGFPFNVTNVDYFANCYFDFEDFTNDNFRAASESHRINERKHLKGLRDALRDNFTATHGEATKPPQKCAAFLYRPGWILDKSGNPDTNNTSKLWWTYSSVLPPIHNFDTRTIDGRYQLPSQDGFGFFPTFEWTTTPIATKSEYGWVQNRDWPCYCVTWEMASAGYSQGVVNPARELFAQVGYNEQPTLAYYVRPYDFGHADELNTYRWLTNAFGYCVMQFRDRGDCFDDYVAKCWGSNASEPTRRLEANDYAGVNQLLAAMDATIHIPSMTISVNTNKIHDAEVSRSYATHEDAVAIHITLDTQGELVDAEVDGDSHSFYGGAQAVTDDVSFVELVQDRMHAKATAPTNSLSVQVINQTATAEVWDEGNIGNWLAGYLELPDGLYVVELENSVGFKRPDKRASFDIGYRVSNEGGGVVAEGWVGYGSAGAHLESTNIYALVTAYSTIRREYRWEESLDRFSFGPTQPGKDAGEIGTESQVALLAREDYKRFDADNELAWQTNRYASSVQSYTDRRSLTNTIISAANDFCDEQAGVGGWWNVPSAWAPTPQNFSTALVVDGASVINWAPGGCQFVSSRPFTKDGKTIYAEGWAEVYVTVQNGVPTTTDHKAAWTNPFTFERVVDVCPWPLRIGTIGYQVGVTLRAEDAPEYEGANYGFEKDVMVKAMTRTKWNFPNMVAAPPPEDEDE